MLRTIKIVIGTLVVSTVIGGLSALAFIYSGFYNLAANEPHLDIMAWAAGVVQTNSVRKRASKIEVPHLARPEFVRTGFQIYRERCEVCHGAPGRSQAVIGRGLNPAAPQLATRASEWNNAELFWITRNGQKMTGMPAFSTELTDDQIWAVVAFMRRLPQLTPDGYSAMAEAIAQNAPLEAVPWILIRDHWLTLMQEHGDPDRGRVLLDDYGCGACHVIPGIRGARGKAAPTLERWAERHLIAGNTLNTPRDLVSWIMNPDAIEPGTAMPNLGVTADQALDMAAYLFTLGTPPQALHTVLASFD